MPHVLFLTHWYPTSEMPVNGTFVREHARAAALYNSVTLIHIQGIDARIPDTYTLERHEDGNLIEIHLKYHKHPIPRMTWTRRISGVDRIVNELIQSNRKPDVIHANVFSSADLAAWLSFRYKIPAVLSEHASSYPRREFGFFKAAQIRFYNNRLRRIMPVSKDLGQHIQAHGIRTRCQVVPNVVDTKCFYPPPSGRLHLRGKTNILVVARLVPMKGVDSLLAALKRLSANGKEFEVGLVGDGPERRNLEMIIQQLNLEEQVTFYGVKSREEIAELLRKADLLALTSYWENQPVVLLEALASGLPVVAPNVGGIPEVIKPEQGALIEPGNIESIISGLSSVIDHLKDYDPQAIARYARDHFSYEAVGSKFTQIYNEVIQETSH
jgi:glycosyltransferase involved in cell wall biosynthesis